MAEISLKIKSDFEKASADFKALGTLSEATQKQFAKLQAQMAEGSIDKFMQKNKLNAAAMTATKGATAGLTAELAGLQREMSNMIKKGLDPMSPALDKMKARMGEIQGQLPKATSGFGDFGNAIKLAAGVFAGSQLASKILSVGTAALSSASKLQSNTIAFTTMLNSGTEATKLLDQITRFAEKTPFQKEDLIEYAKAMVGVGFSTSEIIPTMEMLGNIAAGVGMEKLPNIVKAFDKMKAKGKASLEELWPIVEAGVPILDQLAKDMGKSKDEIIKMATAGKLSFEQVNSSMKKVETTKFAGLMSQLSGTIGGQWSNFNDQLERTSTLFGQAMLPAAQNMLGVMGNLLGIANGLVEKYNIISGTQTKQVGYLELYNQGLNGTGEKLAAIVKYEKDKMGYALLYNEYLKGDKKLSDVQVAKLQEILKLNRSIAEIQGSAGKGEKGVKGTKIPEPPKVSSPGKTEAQIMQDNLNAMAMSQVAYEQQRLNTMQSFYDQRMALQGIMNEEEMAAFVAQETMKIANSKLTDDQKLAAMKALDLAVKKQANTQLRSQVEFGLGVVNTASAMVSDLQTIMKNAGKQSAALAYSLKGIAIAEATISSYLAFDKVLASTAFAYPWNFIAAGLTLAAGMAKVGAIATTPIPKAETGLSSYIVPDIRANRNDGASVMAQAGEEVSVSPRGESGNGLTNININVSEQTIFSIVAKGIKTGQIDLNSKNVGRGVFAN